MIKDKKRNSYNLLSTAVLMVATLTVIIPLLWVAFTSLKSTQEFYVNIWGLPQKYEWKNYVEAWNKTNFGKNFINSILVTIGALLINLICSTTTAYAIGRYKYRGRNLTNGIYMASMMIPGIIGLIPQYFLLANMKLLDSRLGLTLVYGFSSIPFSVFTLLGFFKTLPHELEEAAMIDGASHYQTFFRIMFPLAQPGIITVCVVNFIGNWNEYYKAMAYLSTPDRLTIPVSLVNFISQCQYRIAWGPLMASCILMTIPTILIYCIFCNFIQKGLTAGAVKG
ncbi:MAG: carbohydrate ABC transporter permease [Eubacteriales bacterium]|nr:carbohydrate ABC transporter permease [Eubacteriales bacterium]